MYQVNLDYSDISNACFSAWHIFVANSMIYWMTIWQKAVKSTKTRLFLAIGI